MKYSTLGFAAVCVLQAASALGYKDKTHEHDAAAGEADHVDLLVMRANEFDLHDAEVQVHRQRTERLTGRHAHHDAITTVVNVRIETTKRLRHVSPATTAPVPLAPKLRCSVVCRETTRPREA